MVVDADVIVNLLLGDLDPSVTRGEDMLIPHLLDSEVTHVLRRLVGRGDISEETGRAAMESFIALALTRSGVDHLRWRMWELKSHLTGYDATYVALAESLKLSLLTTDQRIARAPGLRCTIDVV